MATNGEPSWWDGLSIFTGIEAFKGPIDQGQNGNHGIFEGFNYAVPLSFYYNIGGQIGLRATQSNFSGTNLSADQLAYFSQVCASIMGVEAEHRSIPDVGEGDGVRRRVVRDAGC